MEQVHHMGAANESCGMTHAPCPPVAGLGEGSRSLAVEEESRAEQALRSSSDGDI